MVFHPVRAGSRPTLEGGSLLSIFKRSYLTLLPGATATHLDRAGARHGTLTPPRISPSCPQCLWLWLGRSIIVGQRRLGRGKPPQLALRTDGRRSSPCLAVFYAGVPGAGGLGASSAVLFRWLMYPDGRIFTFEMNWRREYFSLRLYTDRKWRFEPLFLKSILGATKNGCVEYHAPVF